MSDDGDRDEYGGSPKRRTTNRRSGADDSYSKSQHHHDVRRDSSSRREKEKEKGRDRDQGSRNRDRDMVKYQDSGRELKEAFYRDHSKRREAERERNDDNHSGRENDSRETREHRHRHKSDSREKRSNGRSRSHSPEKRSHHRSSARSRSPSKSKRVSGFDLGPLPPASVHGATTVAGQVLTSPSAVPGLFPNIFPWSSGQATRHARRVYVGGLSPYANEQSIAIFFSHVMAVIGGNSAGPGDAVVNVYINHERKFAFVEMRSVEEASNAMALDGVIFDGASVKVRRPSDYNAAVAASLGPNQPNPNLNLAAVGLTPGSTGGLQGPDQIFVGGIPYFFTEAQVRQLLETFGVLRGFDLVKDRETGNSKGYAFCVYEDLSVAEVACATLNGIKLGDKTLTVRRPNQGVPQQPKLENGSMLLYAQQQQALQKLELQPGMIPTKVLCLKEAVTTEELNDDEAYDDIMKDMTSECEKFGTLVKVVIPRPSPNGDVIPGVGKVFLEYAAMDSASKARHGLHGRKFGGNEVVGIFYPENKFAHGDYEG